MMQEIHPRHPRIYSKRTFAWKAILFVLHIEDLTVRCLPYLNAMLGSQKLPMNGSVSFGNGLKL